MLKSIKQQYIDLQEGRMSQANFMRNLRMTMPQYITNVTSFNDSVKILKNKGILTENEVKYTAAEELAKQMGDYDSAVVALQDKMGLSAMEADNVASKIYPDNIDLYPGNMGDEMSAPTSLEEATIDTESIFDIIKPDGTKIEGVKFFKNGEWYKDTKTGRHVGGKVPTGAKVVNHLKEAKAKWENAGGKEMYAQFKEIDNANGHEILIGIDYEMEKNESLTKKEATKIAIKNLKKNPLYYTMTDLAGKEGAEAEYLGGKSANAEARQMQPLDKNKGNVVDKKMGMQPVKGIEKAKKDSDKATAEKYKTSGISLMSLVAKTVRGVQKMDATGEKMKTIKEGLNENENYYQTNVKLKPEEVNSIKKVLPDAEFEWDEDDRKQVVYSSKSEQEIRNIVNQVLGLGPTPISKVKPGIGDAAQTKLTKEYLMQIIHEELAEMFDGRDNMTDVAGHQLDEEK